MAQDVGSTADIFFSEPPLPSSRHCVEPKSGRMYPNMAVATRTNSYGRPMSGVYGQPSIYGGGQSAASGAPSYSGVFGQRFTSKLTPQEKEIIDVAFDSFKDEKGFITTEKLKEAFEAIGAL